MGGARRDDARFRRFAMDLEKEKKANAFFGYLLARRNVKITNSITIVMHIMIISITINLLDYYYYYEYLAARKNDDA